MTIGSLLLASILGALLIGLYSGFIGYILGRILKSLGKDGGFFYINEKFGHS